MKNRGFIFFILVFECLNLNIYAQRLLQLEVPRQIEAVKFGEGDKITFKSKDRPGEWQIRVIETIIPGDDLIVFEDGMVKLSEITHFRIYNGTAKAFGQMLTGFGGAWFLFGGVAQLAGKYKFSWGTFAIGAVAVGVGWLLNKIISRRTFRIGKNGNLRIIDISFPGMTSGQMQREKIP